VTFEDPRAAFVALAALLPLGGFALTRLRARSVATALGLRPAPARAGLAPVAAAVLACLLLGAAAARPALVGGGEREVRTDSEVLFVVDVTRSMLAAAAPGEPTRLDRAREAARRLRDAVPAVPAGLAGLTDRVLPYAFPSPDRTVFLETLARSVAVDAPPPRARAVVATTFSALADISPETYFGEAVSRRTCVLLTDGESRPFVARPGERACRFLIVRVGTPQERVFDAAGTPEPRYRPDPAAAQNVELLAAATGGRAWPEPELAAAAEALRAAADAGPVRTVRADERNRQLAALPAAAALALTLLVAGRALTRRRLASPVAVWPRAPASP
jgi:hypothetical protein